MLKEMRKAAGKMVKGAGSTFKNTYKANIAADKKLGLNDPISKASAGIKGVMSVGAKAISKIPRRKTR